jgi:hypothetical protein
MAIRLDAFAMVLAKAETQMAWHNLEPHQRNCWRELARCILVESEEFLRHTWDKKRGDL